jgi:hypothetical protein
MGKVTKTIIITTKEVTKETVKFGGKVVVGVCSGIRYLFGKPFPKR